MQLTIFSNKLIDLKRIDAGIRQNPLTQAKFLHVAFGVTGITNRFTKSFKQFTFSLTQFFEHSPALHYSTLSFLFSVDCVSDLLLVTNDAISAKGALSD